MQKVYLLLRNNQQTGPHSLNELLQMNLKPFDLIWVEGKSYGWSYPAEIETIKPFVKFNIPPSSTPVTEAIVSSDANKSVSNKKIFVSMPGERVSQTEPVSSASSYDPIEQKAEELRRRVQSYVPQPAPAPEELTINYNRSLNDVEEDYTSWVYKTKKKKLFNAKYALIACIVVAGLAIGWWAATEVYTKPVAVIAKSTVTNNTNKKNNATEKTVVSPPEINDASDLKQASDPAFVAGTQPTSQPSSSSNRVVRKLKDKKEVLTIPTKKEKAASPVLPASTQDEPVIQTEQKTAAPPAEEKNQPVATEAPKEKKRSLKTLFGGLFKKNKKEETPQETRSADNSNNERNSTRRSEESAPAIVDLSDEVDIRMNKGDDDWMMGVQGLKLTLYNRSTATLKNASVEVLYYSEQNNLLQKKVIHFSNIPSGKSQTVAAPDHRLADHIDYKILSATGEENAYAKQAP
jgi:hypothetical protein